MKVLLVTNMYPSESLPYSGIFVKAQYEYFKTHFAEKDRVNIFFMRQVISSGIMTYLKYLMAYVNFLPHLFKKYDVVHVHFLGMLAPVANLYKFFRPSTKLVLTLHGGDINDDMPEEGKKNNFFRRIIKKFDLVVPVGPALHEPLKRKLGRTPDNTLCAGVDHNLFYRLQREKIYDFVVVGSFLPVKGLDTLVKALQEDDMPRVRLCFVGNGPLEPLLHQLSNKHDVTILNNKSHSELREIYNQSKFLLFTSRGDAFGLVVTEAIYCGTPAIVCKTGGGAHQIEEGVNGYIYSENTVEVIKEQLITVINMPQSEYKKLALTTVDTNHQFALQTVCEVYYGYYRNTNYSTAFNNLQTANHGTH
ncbi:MAG: glycosyltransferase family 4 protein [Flavobacteriales bacterium]